MAFDEAYAERWVVELEEMAVPLLSRAHLIRNKESTGRPKDQLDLLMLRKQRS
ncbi:MAG: hypothetical protein OZSIB_3919 [Candidatus Ozemobacter sibiricus]|uniref:Uncharacterized protein n=1 Tax=Candidatus Ozemobacter sibiricus TaxID=2268124 RepID=A0A367ZNR5_9BACT|nr:MAG: hypothetical protein OZSIB_3919 [Candidatus Ozemobacter sibiricus]